MQDSVIHIDYLLFEFINSGLSNSFFDTLMPVLRNKLTWIPLYLLLSLYLITTRKKEGFYIIVFAALTAGLTDIVSSHILKSFFERIRPCHLEEHILHVNLLLKHCSGGYSFPSSHAANHFGLAVILGLAMKESFPRLIYWFLLWAFAVSFAQIYVGVHFPLDIAGGAATGIAAGYGMYRLLLFVNRKRQQHS
jgi:membrane-associated phospholipid phosphatase